jgi:Zn-dependent peptidase ImmA (M78 family)
VLERIGEIVARARTREHLGLDTLAKRADVDAALLRSLEGGAPGITTTQLDRVAVALGLDGASLLLGQEVLRPRMSVFLRHSGAQDFDHDAEALLDQALEAGRTLRFLDDRLGVEPGLRRSGAIPVREPGPGAAQDGYELARWVRRALLKTPSEPLRDLGALLEERFEVVVLDLPLGTEKMTAVGVRDASGAAAVVLNEQDPQRRENPQLARVHLAHELCHILHDPSDGGLHLVIERTDDDARGRSHERGEQRAKAFAAELLLPLHGLVDLLGTPKYTQSEGEGRSLAAGARRHFCTPWEIAVNHLNHQGFIADEVRLALLRQGPEGAPQGEIGTRLPKAGEPSIAVRDRVRRAHEDGFVTDGQVRVALGLTVDERLPWD